MAVENCKFFPNLKNGNRTKPWNYSSSMAMKDFSSSWQSEVVDSSSLIIKVWLHFEKKKKKIRAKHIFCLIFVNKNKIKISLKCIKFIICEMKKKTSGSIEFDNN